MILFGVSGSHIGFGNQVRQGTVAVTAQCWQLVSVVFERILVFLERVTAERFVSEIPSSWPLFDELPVRIRQLLGGDTWVCLSDYTETHNMAIGYSVVP